MTKNTLFAVIGLVLTATAATGILTWVNAMEGGEKKDLYHYTIENEEFLQAETIDIWTDGPNRHMTMSLQENGQERKFHVLHSTDSFQICFGLFPDEQLLEENPSFKKGEVFLDCEDMIDNNYSQPFSTNYVIETESPKIELVDDLYQLVWPVQGEVSLAHEPEYLYSYDDGFLEGGGPAEFDGQSSLVRHDLTTQDMIDYYANEDGHARRLFQLRLGAEYSPVYAVDIVNNTVEEISSEELKKLQSNAAESKKAQILAKDYRKEYVETVLAPMNILYDEALEHFEKTSASNEDGYEYFAVDVENLDGIPNLVPEIDQDMMMDWELYILEADEMKVGFDNTHKVNFIALLNAEGEVIAQQSVKKEEVIEDVNTKKFFSEKQFTRRVQVN